LSKHRPKALILSRINKKNSPENEQKIRENFHIANLRGGDYLFLDKRPHDQLARGNKNPDNERLSELRIRTLPSQGVLAAFPEKICQNPPSSRMQQLPALAKHGRDLRALGLQGRSYVPIQRGHLKHCPISNEVLVIFPYLSKFTNLR
jgi:hypothetical protein